MGEVRVLPVVVTGVRLADAITAFVATIGPPNTRRGYATALNRMRQDFGADADTARLDPDRVAGWFTFVWGPSSPQTFNVRLAGLRKAFEYWREQRWLADDPLTRLRTRPVARDDSRALTRAQIAELLGLDAALRERVLWRMLYETAALVGGPFTLHQLRHSALTHAAEDGASTPMLMKMSGHTSVRSLARYARPSAEALARWRAQTDPAARGHR
jgi:site-specific recombinase XerD